jgi:hypothetical protein
MSTFKVGRAGTGTCRERQYPLFKDNEQVGCFYLPKDAANHAREEFGATEVVAFDIDNLESTEEVVVVYQDGKWVLK